MTETSVRQLTGVPVIPRGARLHDVPPFGRVSSSCGSVDVPHQVMRGSNPRPVRFSWRQGKVKEWSEKAVELDNNGLFVAAGVARGMANHYRKMKWQTVK